MKSFVDKKETFITAIKDNEGLIYKVASVYTNTIEDRKDLVQEIIYQLWKSFDSFNQKSGLRVQGSDCKNGKVTRCTRQ